MATWFDSVTVFVEVAWDATPFGAVDSITWTDETAYVRGTPSISSKRGRNTELSDFAPGTMSVTFDNRTRRFDASNTAGALYGKLLPMKQIRWRVVYSGTTAYLFTGLILGFPITYPGFTDSTVTVNCVDRTRLLEQAALPGSAYAAEVLADSPTYYWPLQQAADDPSTPNVIPGPDLAGFGSPTLTSDTGYPLGEDVGIRLGAYVDDDWVWDWRAPDSAFTLPTTLELVVAEVGLLDYPSVRAVGSTGDVLEMILIGANVSVLYSNSSANKRNVETTIGGLYTRVAHNVQSGQPLHLVVVATSATIILYVNGVAVSTTSTETGTRSGVGSKYYSLSMGVADGSVMAVGHFAAYHSSLSAARVKAHWLAGLLAYGVGYGERTGTRCDRVLDTISWPAADVDLSTGETFCGNWLPDSGSALAAIRELEDAEQGLAFISGRGYLVFRDRQWQMTNTRSVNAQVVFDDDGTDVKYVAVSVDGNHIDHIRNQVTVTYPGGSVTVKDQTSITAYGPQSDSVNANPLPAGASFLARQLANFRLSSRKDPAARVPAIEIKPRTNMATSFAVATLEIGDRVQVIRRPTGGTGTISKFCQVQGIEHSMSADDWTIRLYLAPAPKSYTEAPYLIAGSTSASYVGVASGNLVPY